MADIFISYARNDLDRVKPIAEALQAHGWEVWWDISSVRTGQSFNKAIQEALTQVNSVVVVWSATSANSKWVEAEAYWAWEKDKLASVLIDEGLQLHVPFNTTQSDNLSSWTGDAAAPVFQKIISDLTEVVGPPGQSHTEQAERRRLREQAAKREAALEAIRKSDEEKAKPAGRERQEATEQLKAKEEAAKRKAEEVFAAHVPEPDHPTVPSATRRSPLTTLPVLGGIVIVAIVFAVVIISIQGEPDLEPYVPTAETPAETAKPSDTTATSPELAEFSSGVTQKTKRADEVFNEIVLALEPAQLSRPLKSTEEPTNPLKLGEGTDLYKRVITLPGAKLFQKPDFSSKVLEAQLPIFEVFYVYGRRDSWVRVGHKAQGPPEAVDL